MKKKNEYNIKEGDTKINTDKINTEHNPQDVYNHITPPMTPIPTSHKSVKIGISHNGIKNTYTNYVANTNDPKPLIQKFTDRETILTNRILYPNTRLPTNILSKMPVFKNRLHRLNVYRRLFEDVDIETMSFDETTEFHKRASSIAMVPNIPGYHLKTVTIENMKSDLHKIWKDIQLQLDEEKKLNEAEKIKHNTAFENHVEAARSLLPEEMCLDDSFPVGSIIGLTRDEASTLLLHYHESQDIVKNTSYYKKRDATIFLSEIFAILDCIQSEKLLLSPTSSDIDSDDEDDSIPPVESNIDDKNLAIVTPVPPSPSKRRRTDNVPVTSLQSEMDGSKSPAVLTDMLNLTWNEIQNMNTENIKKLIAAYATHKEFDLIEEFFDTDNIDEQRDSLTRFTIEFLAENRPSTIHAESSNEFIENMEPLQAYLEYYLAYIVGSDDCEASRALLFEVEEIQTELKVQRDNLKHYTNDALLTNVDDDNSTFGMEPDDVEENLLNMSTLTWNEIMNMDGEHIKNNLIAYSNKYQYPISETFFDGTILDDQRELLITYTVELHTKISSSYITGRTSDSEIDEMETLWAYFEYYYIYMMESGDNDVALAMFMEIDDVKRELKSARDQLCMKRKNDGEDEDETDEEGGGDDGVYEEDEVKMEYDNDVDIHMFYYDDDTSTIRDEHKAINDMFVNTIQYHKDNDVTEFEMDKDLTSIIGALNEKEIELLSPQASCTLLRSYNRLGGDDRSFYHYAEWDTDKLRETLRECNRTINEFQNYKGKSVDLDIKNLTKKDIKILSFEQCQMMLFRHYRDSDSNFRNTFGQNKKILGEELEKIIKKHATKKTVKKTKQDKSTSITGMTQKSTSMGTKTNRKVRSTDIARPNQQNREPFRISAQTTNEQIDNVHIDDARSEYFRHAMLEDKKITIDMVLRMKSEEIRSGLRTYLKNVQNKQIMTSQEFHLTWTTSDTIIKNLNPEQCKYVISTYGMKRDVRIDPAYLQTLSKQTLIDEVLNARNEMKQNHSNKVPNETDTQKSTSLASNGQNTNTYQHIKNTQQLPQVPNTNKPQTNQTHRPSTLNTNIQNSTLNKQLAENLNGANVSAFDTYKPKQATDIRAPPKPLRDNEQDIGHQAATVDRSLHTIHASIQTNSSQINPPHEVRKLIVQMRKGDPMIQIVPFEQSGAAPGDTIGNESELPDDATKLGKWIENIRTVETKIHFTMKIKTINIDNVKTAIFSWCKGKGTFIKFTQLASSRIFTGGWFHGIHPFYYNRDDFSGYIFSILPHLREKVDIYQKKVWKKNKTNERIMTLAIVIDGDFNVKDEVLDMLYTHQFQGRYSNVTFVPYASNDEFTPDDQIRLMMSNNVYQSELSRIIIKVKDASLKHDIDGEKFSFQDWLCETTIEQQKVILGVEVAPDDVVRVIFNKKDVELVRDAIHDLYGITETIFGKRLTKHMLDENDLKRAKTSIDTAKAHTKKLRSITSNPQGPDDLTHFSQPKQGKARCYYGTYLEVAQGNLTQTSEITHDSIENEPDLRKQVIAIANAQKSMETNMNSTISSAVTSSIQAHINPIQTQLNNIQTNHNNQVDQFMIMMNNLATTTNAKFDSIQNSFRILGVQAQAPSEAQISPHGVGL